MMRGEKEGMKEWARDLKANSKEGEEKSGGVDSFGMAHMKLM